MAEGAHLIRLSRLLQPSKVSEVLTFLDPITDTLLGKIYAKNLSIQRSPKGEEAQYNLDLVFPKPVSIGIFETGMALVLNPSLDGESAYTEFNVSLAYRLPILRYIPQFDPEDFGFTAEEIVDLVLEIFQTDTETLLSGLTFYLAEQVPGRVAEEEAPYVQESLSLEELVAEINTAFELNGTSNEIGSVSSFADIVSGMETAGLTETDLLMHFLLEGLSHPKEMVDSLVEFFVGLFEETFPGDFADLLVPSFSTSVNDLRLALEFPRAWLLPLDEAGEPIEDEAIKSKLIFNAGKLAISTADGLTFEKAGDFDFQKSEIMGTGLTLAVDDLLLDLSATSNIPAADAESRPLSFKGVSIASVEIGLPKKWEKDDSTSQAKIIGTDLLIGSEGGFSGQLALDTSASSLLRLALPGDVVLAFDRFSIDFVQNAVDAVDITGHITLPALKDPDTGEDGEVAIEIGYAEGTYSLSADVSGGGIPLKISGLELSFQSFGLDFNKSGVTGTDLAGKLKLPGLKDSTGAEAEVDFELDIDTEGWKISASESDGVKLSIPQVVDIIIYSLEIGRKDKKVYIAVVADFDILIDVPVLGDLLPDKILLEYFKLWQDGTTEDVDISVEWQSASGVEISVGDGEFAAVIPVNKTLFNFATIDTVDLLLDYGTTGKVDFQALLTGGIQLGPVTGTVKKIGLGLEIAYSESGGNIGPLDITPRFVPPEGIGVAIDAGVVKGGGYIEFEPDNNRYVGMLELTIQEVISLKAIGILTTEMPDGSKGISFFMLVTAEFAPLPLGFGFTLNGVGGLAGVNRTMMLDVMQQGLKTGALDSILFPQDVVKNAAKIISDLESIFPIEQGRYVFGPMGMIGWGAPTLITLEVGLLLEVPNPVRLAILGILKMALPDEDAPALILQVAFLGIIDFEQKYLSFDASIYDSRILTFTLEGDMAVRLTWGDEPNFLLSIGGFHPDYTPPPLNLPDMTRLTINLLTGNNPRLTLSAYFALTSNTVQVGARAELYIRVAKVLGKTLSVEGFLGFDALFQFSPFYFIISIEAGLSVIYGKKALLSIYLGGSLEGPTPWRVQGRAEFKVLGVKFKARVDKTFGKSDQSTLPDKEVEPLLVEALADSRNWTLELPAAHGGTVTVKEINPPEEVILADPVSGLGVTQKIVPTEVEISKFGHYKPKGNTRKFTISLHDSDGQKMEASPTYEQFAASQYFDKKEEERISGKSFERMKAGIQGKAGEELESTHFLEREVAYEETIYDGENVVISSEKQGLDKATFAARLRGNAVARAAMAVTKLKSPPKAVRLVPATYAVVSRGDQSIFAETETSTAIEAAVELSASVTNNQKLITHLQVVPATELISS